MPTPNIEYIWHTDDTQPAVDAAAVAQGAIADMWEVPRIYRLQPGAHGQIIRAHWHGPQPQLHRHRWPTVVSIP